MKQTIISYAIGIRKEEKKSGQMLMCAWHPFCAQEQSGLH